MLGEGELLTNMQLLARELEIEHDVIFAGAVTRPEDYFCAIDVFMLPSLFEGFGISAIEAHASGLPAVLSDGVPRSIAIFKDVAFLPLDSEDAWAKQTAVFADKTRDRCGAEKAIHEHGFDVSDTAKKIISLYGE